MGALREGAREIDAVGARVDDEAARNARIALLAATRQVLANGLAIIGVSAPAKM